MTQITQALLNLISKFIGYYKNHKVFLFIFYYFFLVLDLIEKYFVYLYKEPALQEKGEVEHQEQALEITKIQREDTFKHYNYAEEVLNQIRALVPNDVKGEILEDWYKVSLKEFCEAFQNKLLKCFIGSQYFFVVKLHSAVSNNIKNAPHYKCFL